VAVESVAGYPLKLRDKRVYRITARENPAVNGFWICDLGRDGRHDIDDGRHARLLNKGRPEEGSSWAEALAEVAAAIRSVPGPERAARIAVVLNSRLTCEELALAKRLFVEALGLRKVFFADRTPGPADGLLLTAERAPNGRGVLEAGFEPRLPALGELAAADVLLVFGPYLLEHFEEGELAAALSAAGAMFLFSAHSGPLDRPADIVFPVTVPVEKSGTYVNITGVRQAFARAVKPCEGVVPEGDILSCLARSLGLNLGEADAR
jgi:NADH-quinone oxidoreductase subunit G